MSTEKQQFVSYILISTITAVISISASVYFTKYAIAEQEPTIQFAVLDFDKQIAAIDLNNPNHEQQVNLQIEKIKKTTKDLAQNGYIVLDKSAVIEAPDSVIIK